MSLTQITGILEPCDNSPGCSSDSRMWQLFLKAFLISNCSQQVMLLILFSSFLSSIYVSVIPFILFPLPFFFPSFIFSPFLPLFLLHLTLQSSVLSSNKNYTSVSITSSHLNPLEIWQWATFFSPYFLFSAPNAFPHSIKINSISLKLKGNSTHTTSVLSLNERNFEFIQL